MANWKRGTTLSTSQTRRWSQQEWDKNEKNENQLIFSDFTPADSGKSRNLVCKLNEHHPDFEWNRKVIEYGPDMVKFLNYIIRHGEHPEVLHNAIVLLDKINYNSTISKFESCWENINQSFDWETTQNIMEQLNWRWASAKNGVPTIDEIKTTALYLISNVYFGEEYCATGGLEVYWEEDDIIVLVFNAVQGSGIIKT